MTAHILSRTLRVAALAAILAVETGAVALAEVPGEDEGLNAILMAAEKSNLVRQANSGSALVTKAEPVAPATTAAAKTDGDKMGNDKTDNGKIGG